jgi:hypothetical protein
LWFAAVPLVLLALAWGALAVLLPPARATQLVRTQLARSLGRDVRFERVQLSLWPPVRLSVQKLELAEPGGFGHGTAFAARAVDLDLDVLALLGRRVRVRRLSLDSPALHLVLRADGSTNFDGLAAAPAAGKQAPPALDLDLRDFCVRAGQLLIDDVRAARRISLLFATRTSLSAEQGGVRVATAGETMLSQLAFGPLSAARSSDLNQGFAKLEWRVVHRGKYDANSGRLALEKLALQLGGTQLTLSGRVDSLGPRARFDLHALGEQLDLAQILSWVSVADAKAVRGLSGRGLVAFDLALRGSAAPGARPVVTGVLAVKSAAFRYPGAPAEVADLSLTANFRPDTLIVPDLKASVSGQPVSARLRVWRFADPLVEFALRGNLDLAALAPLLAPAGTQLAGHADVDVSGRGRMQDAGALALAGGADLHEVSVLAAGLPKRVERMNGRVEFAAERAVIRELSAHAGPSSFTLDASVTRPLALLGDPLRVLPAQVQFTFRSPWLDLADVLPTTPGAPFLPNARGGGQVSIARLKQGKLDVEAVAAEVQLSPAVLAAPHFAMQGYGGTVSGEARFDLRDTRKPVYEIRAVIEKVRADAILGVWSPVKDLLVGTLDTKLTFSGAGQTPADLKSTLTLVGLAALTEGRLGPGPALEAVAQFVKVPKLKQLDFARLELPLRIEHGRLVTDPVVLSGPNGEWRFAGAVGFDGALDYAVSVTLPPAAVEALGARSALAAGALSDPQGRMLIDLHVSGSARAPRVSWDANAMRARLAGRASEALLGQRAKLELDARQAAKQALLERLGAARDSTAPRATLTPGAVRDSLKSATHGLLKNFFGRGSAPPVPVPASAPAVAPDTTQP